MKYLLLYNPVSGKGKFHKRINTIKKEFNKRNLTLDIYESKEAKDLTVKARELAAKYDVFLVSGGDGTINEVLNGIMTEDKKPILAVIPGGTANDTAAILGMKRNIKKTLKMIFNNNPVKMDINQINDHYFIYTIAAGALTPISYMTERKLLKKYGYFAYLAAGLKDLLNDYQMKMAIEYDHGIVEGEFMLLLGLSAKRVAGFNLRRFSPNTKLNDGLIEIRLINYTKKTKLSKIIFFFLLRGYKHRLDYHLQSSHFKIATSDKVTWNIDGEKGPSGNTEIKVLKESLEVIVSKKTKEKLF